MSWDFVKDMQNKMVMIKRTARNYETTSDYAIASVYEDIQRRFKHMCDMYKQFATVERYVFGKDVNDTDSSADVILVYQIMLSDYNEIMMILELLKMEQKAWSKGTEEDELRELIKKQMNKFLNVPEPPKMYESHLGGDSGPGGPSKSDGSGKSSGSGGGGRRRWVPTATAYSYRQQKWTGELDGVSFDSR